MILTLLVMVMNYACLGQKIFTPASNNNITGGNTYCQNVTAGAIVYTYNTCNVGSGTSTGTFITIKWYKNSVNSTSGGSVVSTTLVHCALTATGTTTYQPSTSATGTSYYYCIISWTDAGTCNATGSVTSSTAAVIVNPSPDVITGSTTGCSGTSSTLYNSIAGGTWTSATPSVATISTAGVVSAVAVGTSTITYALGSCRTTASFTVITTPNAITGTNTICENATTIFSTTTPGGTWTSANGTVATVDASSPVNITGITAGSTTISYVISPTCYATRAITVNTAPAAITGPISACTGTTATLANTVAGGTWTSSATAKATIGAGTGILSAIAAGSTTISYTIGSCRSTLSFTVNTTPVAITGTNTICQGVITTFTDLTSGGTWSSGNATIATINGSNPVGITGLGAGSTNISYTMPTGCYATRSITVNTAPTAITGATSACLGSSVTLGNTVGGGTWTSSAPSKATISGSGVVTTVANGTTTISYAIGSCSSSITFTTLIPPAAIGGAATNQCQGTTRTYTNTTIGGTWNCSNTSIASINSSTGILTGISAGSATITYSTGCGSPATRSITIVANPSAISGTSNMCTGIATTLTNTTPSGVWTSSNTTIASVNSSTGQVAPLTAGSVTISYTTGGVCTATTSVIVNTQPGAITGTAHICAPSAITLGNSLPGGIWSSSNATIATTNATTGITNVISNGTVTISYTLNNCTATTPLIVSATPTASITSATNPCVNSSSNIVFSGTSGATITYNIDGGSNLTQTLTGGTYSVNSGIITSAHTYNLVAVNDAFCSAILNTAATITPVPMQWVGGTAGLETEWNEANNWTCGRAPDSTSDVTIPSGINYLPVIAAGQTKTIKSLTIDNGAMISTSASSVLNIKRDITINGRITGNGTTRLNGNAVQNISGTGYIDNLQLANSTGAVINTGSKLTIIKALTISQGTFNTNDSLTLASDSVATARVGELTTGTSIIGKIKIQQYIPGGYRRYRFFSHPFNSAISLSQVQRYIDITGLGGASNGFTTTGSNAASAYRLDPYTSNSTMGYDPGWKPFTKINNLAADTNKLQPHQGIRLFMRGSKGEGLGFTFHYTPSPATITMTGVINQGTQLVTLAKGIDTTQDYNMVGNPYPSPVDIGTVMYNAKQEGKIRGSAFYVWNPTMGSGGQYMAIPIGSSAPIPYSIQALTAFQVRAAYDSAQIQFNENNKTQGASSSLFKPADDILSFKIYDTNYHLYDMLQIKYNATATDEEDREYDAAKPTGIDFGFYSLSASMRKLAIDTRPYSTQKPTLLGVHSAYEQAYIITADNVPSTGDSPLYLHDKLLSKFILLQQGTEYRFTISKDKATQGDDRFELTAQPQPIASGHNITVALAPNPATDEVNLSYNITAPGNVSINLIDMWGVNVYHKETTKNSSIETIPLSDLASGIYIVEVRSGTEISQHKLVKE